MSKVGIYGGSFDPIHFGHIGLAKQALSELSLDKLYFVPAKYQPFKLDKGDVADDRHRINMINLAIGDIPKVMASDIELQKQEISYTVNTLRRLSEEGGEEDSFFFIQGTDSFLTIEKWYMAEELLSENSFAVGIRPGDNLEMLMVTIDRIQKKYGTSIRLLHNERLPISSTDIKKLVREGKRINHLTPEAVERYIYEQGLYL